MLNFTLQWRVRFEPGDHNIEGVNNCVASNEYLGFGMSNLEVEWILSASSL